MGPPQAKNFENFAHFRVLRSNLAKSLTTGHPFLGGPVVEILGGPKHTLAHPLKFLGGGHGPPGPPGSATPAPLPAFPVPFFKLMKNSILAISLCVTPVSRINYLQNGGCN